LEDDSRRLEAQHYIDVEYPPTMTFNVDTLEPTKVLKERVDLISQHFPSFFQGNRLLDVGCSKGYFSLSSAHNFREIEAIDSDDSCVALCRMLNAHKNVRFLHTSFRNYITYKQFDRIFIGNTAHYLFMEIEGWEWICKLAALSCGFVLIEGATSTECKDMKELIPERLQRKFGKFLEVIQRYFYLIDMIPSVSYTPDRYLMLCKRKQPPRFEASALPCIKVFKKDLFKTYLTKYRTHSYSLFMKKIVAKIIKFREPIWRDMNRIRVAAMSPISNGMIGEIWDQGKMVGWLESYSRRRKYRYFENEKELFKKICIHNIFLSKLGYVDLDSATINFFKGSKLLFDKSSVFPISHLQEKSIDVFAVLLRQSYKTINEEAVEKIVAAIKTNDPATVEQAFREVLERFKS